MKKAYWILCLSMIAGFATTTDLEARGGGGGGRGGGGGGSRGGGPRGGGTPHAINRTPSLSRSTSMHRGETRNENLNPNNRRLENRPYNNTATRNQVDQFLRNNPSRTNTAQRNFQPSELSTRWQNNGNDIRSSLANNPNRNNLFSGNFWQDHTTPAYLAGRRDYGGYATAASLAGWMGWANRGYGGDYYYGDGVYYPYAYQETTPAYSPQENAVAINDNSQPALGGWMPLGIFAITKQGLTNANPNFYVQLVLNKQGQIEGTFYNSLANQTYSIEGLVDPNTKRAAWKISGNANSPIAETGIYNLTLPETPIQVTFANGQTQDLLMVRLKQ